MFCPYCSVLVSYSLFSHDGNARKGDVVKEAYKFNQPLTAVNVSGKGSLENEFSLINISSDTVIAETVKQAEDGQGIIVRMYQSANKTEKISLSLNAEYSKCYLCDMLENPTEEINPKDIKIKPFEVVTLKFERN